MARKKAKAGSVFIQPGGGPRGEVIMELTDTLAALDPVAAQGLRASFGSTYLYMADSARRGEDVWWYEEAPRDWRKRADNLFDHITNALQKTAPANHYFSGRRDGEGTIDWGFWPRQEKNPEQAAEDDLLYGGFKENPKAVLVQDGDEGKVYKYRGRHFLIQGPNVQIVRTGKGDQVAMLAEWESRQPFPKLEAVQVIDLMRQQAKGRHKQPRKNPVLPVSVTEGVRQQGSKGAGTLYRAGDYTIDLQPIGEGYEGGDLANYSGMVVANVIAPDETCVTTIATWGGRRALADAKKVIDKQGGRKPDPKATKRGRRLSFMRRMMNI